MLAPSFRISTCAATIPASSTPSSGIHARPRTTRSSSAWSGSDSDERADATADAPGRLRRRLGTARAARAGAVLGAGSRATNGAQRKGDGGRDHAGGRSARAGDDRRPRRPARRRGLRSPARVVWVASLRPGRAGCALRAGSRTPSPSPGLKLAAAAAPDATRGAPRARPARSARDAGDPLRGRRRRPGRSPRCEPPGSALRASCPRRPPACGRHAGAPTSIADWPRSHRRRRHGAPRQQLRLGMVPAYADRQLGRAHAAAGTLGEESLDAPVLERVERDRREPAAGPEHLPHRRQRRVELEQLVVDRDPQRLERPPSRVTARELRRHGHGRLDHVDELLRRDRAPRASRARTIARAIRFA